MLFKLMGSIFIFQTVDPGCHPCYRYSCCPEIHQGEIWCWWADSCWGSPGFGCIYARGDSKHWVHQDGWGELTTKHINSFVLRVELWLTTPSLSFSGSGSEPKDRGQPIFAWDRFPWIWYHGVKILRWIACLPSWTDQSNETLTSIDQVAHFF